MDKAVGDIPRDASAPDGVIAPADLRSADDPLVGVLEILAEHYRKPFSANTVLHGLPLADGRLDIGNFADAASRLGLIAKPVFRKPSQVPGLVCPYVAPLKDGGAVVVTSRDFADKSMFVRAPQGAGRRRIAQGELDALSAGMVIYVADRAQQEAVAGLQKGRAKGHWLWSVAARFWSNWLYVIFAALFINLLGLALPLFVMNVYDRVIPNNSISTLWALAIGVAIALCFDFLLRMIRAVVIDNSGRRVDMRVSASLFSQALDARMSERTMRSGELASHIREFESVRDFFTSSAVSSVIDLLFIGIFLAVLWIIVGPIALVPMIAVPIVLAVTLAVQLPLARSVAQAQATAANRQTVLIEALVGIETVKAVSAQGNLQRKWENAVAGSVRGSSAMRFWSALAMYFTLFTQQAVSVAIIVWGVYLVIAGQITIGALIAANILAGRMLAPLGSIAMTLVRAQQSFTALGHLNRFMRLGRDHDETGDQTAVPNSAALRLSDVRFSYPGTDISALDGLTISIAPGERVGIIGRVGSGKSTLGKLLCGLYQTGSGTIHLGGADVRHVPMADLRRHVLYVGQESDLFSGTLKENIMISNPAADDRFDQCAAVSGVAGFAQAHPLGYAMQVGEGGRAISGGQRQSVAIARALIAAPDIMYFDEPTGAMDNLSEAALVHNLKTHLTGDTTLIVATHRSSLLELVTRLVVLEQGKVVADGPKDKVLAELQKSGQKQRGKKQDKTDGR